MTIKGPFSQDGALPPLVLNTFSSGESKTPDGGCGRQVVVVVLVVAMVVAVVVVVVAAVVIPASIVVGLTAIACRCGSDDREDAICPLPDGL